MEDGDYRIVQIASHRIAIERRGVDLLGKGRWEFHGALCFPMQATPLTAARERFDLMMVNYLRTAQGLPVVE
jgi:hypothetical protein